MNQWHKPSDEFLFLSYPLDSTYKYLNIKVRILVLMFKMTKGNFTFKNVFLSLLLHYITMSHMTHNYRE